MAKDIVSETFVSKLLERSARTGPAQEKNSTLFTESTRPARL